VPGIVRGKNEVRGRLGRFFGGLVVTCSLLYLLGLDEVKAFMH
jgi:hypothetical protein